jgi:hypothetical protein
VRLERVTVLLRRRHRGATTTWYGGGASRGSALVTKMNTVKGNAKVDAIAELLTTMVQQQKTMHDGMMQMHGQMMEPKGGVK